MNNILSRTILREYYEFCTAINGADPSLRRQWQLQLSALFPRRDAFAGRIGGARNMKCGKVMVF